MYKAIEEDEKTRTYIFKQREIIEEKRRRREREREKQGERDGSRKRVKGDEGGKGLSKSCR